MPKKSGLLWLSLFVGSLAITVSFVTGTSVKTSASTDELVTKKDTFSLAQANPCASQVRNVGGTLAEQVQGKPVVVDIYASWCAACKNIAPTLSQLKQEYADKAHFVVLDVTDRSTAAQAESRAIELGLGEFFATNKSQTGMIAIIDPATGNILAQYRNNTNLEDYTSVLNSAISQM